MYAKRKKKKEEGGNTMKTIIFKIMLDDEGNKMATAWETVGLSRDSLEANLLIQGMLDNTKNIISKKIDTLLEKKF
jgi:hypothetical protein